MNNLTEAIAENIKQRRKELGMTQNELASALGYSAKAVSKWESGKGVPPTVMLPFLANALRTNIDSLLSANKEGRFFLGIDGGGTKTEFALADSEGNIIRSVVLGTSNPSDIGIDAALNVIKTGIFEICADIPKSNISVFAGLAGGSTEGIYDQLEDFFARYGFASAKNGSDAMNAVSASLGGENGITVIMGTGSVTFAQVNGKTHRIGGYGYLLGDAGSGFSLGRRAILSALCFEDGSGEMTSLYDMVKEKCGTKRVLDSLGEFYRGGKRTIAQYAPLVLNAYVDGDMAARKILFSELEEVAQTIRGAAKLLPRGKMPIRVELCGGLCTKDDIVMDALREILAKENYSVNICKTPLIIGALRLAGMPDKKND